MCLAVGGDPLALGKYLTTKIILILAVVDGPVELCVTPLRYAQIYRFFQSIVAEVGDNGLIRCQSAPACLNPGVVPLGDALPPFGIRK
jgi:hypothetical protein